MDLDERKVWRLVASGSAVLAAVGTRKLLRGGWRRWRRGEPPENPADPSVGWGEAIAWTVATGVAVGLGRLIARRSAAAGWRLLREENPEVAT